jgi:hypothetical protein
MPERARMRLLIAECLHYLKHMHKMLADIERIIESSRERITISKAALGNQGGTSKTVTRPKNT